MRPHPCLPILMTVHAHINKAVIETFMGASDARSQTDGRPVFLALAGIGNALLGQLVALNGLMHEMETQARKEKAP